MPPNRFESEVESFLEGSHGDRTHIKRADHPRLHHYAGRYSGRTFSRTRRDKMAALKPPTPLLTPNRGALKPASPLRPKNAPKTPISHPQRRWRFQSRLGRHPQRRQGFQSRLDRHPQRRQGFQSHTSTSEQRRRRFQPRLGRRPQRRRRFQTTGPAGLQGQTAVPMDRDDTTDTQMSHVIYRGHFSRHPKNIAIPTIQIQCLNKPQGNYVRN